MKHTPIPFDLEKKKVVGFQSPSLPRKPNVPGGSISRLEYFMASVIADDGTRRIQFTGPDGKKRTVRLGKVPQRAAESVCRHVEELLGATLSGQPVDRQTAEWVKSIGDVLRDRLAATGLIATPQRALLGDFLDNFILNRPDVKPATLEIWKQPCRNLKDYFGPEKPLRSITAGDADQFKQWLSTQVARNGRKLSPSTFGKRLAFARTFFHVAGKHTLIERNPFADVKIPSADVSKRQEYVSREDTFKMLKLATPRWRAIIALVRFGALRCPGEVLSLRLEGINLKGNRITVTSPKTDHTKVRKRD